MKFQNAISPLRAALALLPPLAAFALQWTFWETIRPYAWFLFSSAVFFSSWIGGLFPGLAATLLSTALVWWFFVPPEHGWAKDHPKYFLPAGVFFGMGILFSLFQDRLRKANQQADAALAFSQSANEALQEANEKITRLYEKTKELDNLKTQFFAGVSHELRTPLALILAPAERMLASPETAGAAHRDLDLIARNARTLLQHVNDLLDASKLEAAEMKAEYADADLISLVRPMASQFDGLAREKEITYTVETPDALTAQVDPDKVRRILLNLLSNAFKFTPAGGRVRVTVREEGGRVILEVGESGPGIPPDKREAVFERFRQLEGGATRRFGGTGLGLSIARDFVALHGGTLSVGDAPEGGALFIVNLPRLAPPGTPVRTAPVQQSGAEAARTMVEVLRSRTERFALPEKETGALVLVVEDHPEMNRFISESLAAEYRVAAAFDGKEGMEKAIALKPDLILSDIMMPEMSGDALVQALRAQHRELDATPIVLLTAKADEALRVRLLRDGAQDYLIKPFAVEELRARVGNLIAAKTAKELLRRSEERLRELVEQASDGIFVADLDGRYTEVNRAGARMLGCSREEIVGKTILDLIPPAEADRLWKEKEQLLKGGIVVSEWTLRRKDGTPLPVEVSAKILPGGQWQGFVRDITERKQAEAQLRQAAIVFESTNEGIMIADAAGRLLAVNRAYERISGFRAEEVLGKNPRFQQSGRQDEAFYKQLWAALEKTGQWRGEIWNRRKNGEIYPAWENISAVKDSGGRITHYVSVLSDISMMKQAEERLRHLANHDALTGLPNRLFFTASLEKALERADRRQQKLALLFLDLDRFKLVNDTFGHAAGDRLLQEIGARLQGCVRAEDMVARLGGDEFIVILEEVAHVNDVAHLAEKIVAAVARPVALDGKEVVSSTSIGISLYPGDANNPEDLTIAADAALYRAKERGRHTYEFYTAELNTRALERLSLENSLRRALASGELALYYQPQIDLVAGRIVGVEALIRWHHPQEGMILPKDFIAAAEESGLIESIGDWALRQACAQAAAWRAEGLSPGRIAINLSGRQILNNRLIDTVQAALRDGGLQPSDVEIELEITETLLHSIERSVEVLRRLRRLGIRLAIDHFGTGYSSLSLLKRLPVDTLKIDRTFVRNIPDDTDNKAIAAAIISMGHSLGLRVIAEGVETDGQLAFLLQQGCDEVQGHLLSEAVSAEAVSRLLGRHEPFKAA